MDRYTKPSWSADPITLYTLEVVKDGVSCEEIQLQSKPYFSLGRAEDCDIILAHPSISRYHAVLQHNGNSELFLWDLGSSHGTFVNGKNVSPLTYFQVYTGDAITFAASSRTYLVNGPDEIQRPVTQKMFSEDGRLLLQPKKQPVALGYQEKVRILEDQHRRQQDYEAQVKEKLHEVSWGFAEDAKDAAINPQDKILYEDELDLEQVRMRGDVQEKHLHQIELIEEKRKKLQSLLREASNIEKKEEDQEKGLTKGQSSRLQMNQQRVADLKQEVELEEDTLRNMFLEPESSGKRVILSQESSDEDEYFDRVVKKPKLLTEGLELTYESAFQQYNSALQTRDRLVNALAGLNDATTHEEEDEFEAFMQQNRNLMNAESRSAIAAQMKELNETVQRLQDTLVKLDSGRFASAENESQKEIVLEPVEKPEIQIPPVLEIPTKPVPFGVTPKPAPRNVMEDFSVSTEEIESAYGGMKVPESYKRTVEQKLQWAPPKGQSGDGRTALNDKYKY